MRKVYNEYNLSKSSIFGEAVDEKEDCRITHVQQTSREEQERSFNIEIYKDVVFFLLLVLLRRGLINWLNSVA